MVRIYSFCICRGNTPPPRTREVTPQGENFSTLYFSREHLKIHKTYDCMCVCDNFNQVYDFFLFLTKKFRKEYHLEML